MKKLLTSFAFMALCSFMPLTETELSGSVYDEETKDAIAGAEIEIFLGEELTHALVADEDGSFSVSLSVEGEYTIEVTKEGYVMASTSVDTDDESSITVEIGLDPETNK